jgi:hypothetical protein
LWRRSDAVALAENTAPDTLCSNVRALLGDQPRRLLLGGAGRTLYDRVFAVRHAVRRLTSMEPGTLHVEIPEHVSTEELVGVRD